MSAVYQFCVAKPTAAEEAWIDAADLGVEQDRLARHRLHAGVDKLTFTLKGQAVLTDAPLWAYNTVIRLRRVDGETATLLFLGRVQPFARAATGTAHEAAVEVRGVWDWLEKTVMRQAWLEADESVVYAPHVVLFADGQGGRITTGAQLTQAVQCAIDAGCPVQLGSVLPGYTPPFDEQLNVTVADVIVKCLANHPHAVLWVDYSTRTPTLNVAARQSLPAATVALSAEQSESLAIAGREDLRPPAVAVAFVRTNQDGDRTYIETVIDHAPVIAGETAAQTEARLYAADVVWGTFKLEGSTAQYIEQAVVVEPINWEANKNSVSWWKARCPDLAGATVEAIANPSGQYSEPNFLVEGSCADWMDVVWGPETFTCDATVQTSNSQGVAQRKIVKARFTAVTTNATTKTYRKRISFDSGEGIPSGLAAAMWAEWQQLHHDGEVTLAAQDTPAGFGPGMSLNITGGRAEWASMAAMITAVTEDFGAGRVTVRFGVPQWIDIDSRMAWIRNCRTRRFAWSRDMQGGSAEPSGASGGQAFPASEGGTEATVWLRQRFINPAAAVQHEADINLDDITGETKRTLKFREVFVPVESGEKITGAKRALALVSEPYDEEVPLDIPDPEQESDWPEVDPPPLEIPEGIEFSYEADIIDGAPTIDLNDEEAQAHAHIYIAVSGEIAPGVVHWYRVPHKFIAARFPDRGAEDLSLGIVRGLHNDELSPLMARLAGVDEPPDGGPQKIYGYFTPSFGGDQNPRWGLWELESLFKADLANKRLYMDLAGYSNFKALSSDADTWDFNADANVNGKNGATLDVVTDVSWNAGTKKLTVKKRSVTLFKFGLKTIAAANPVESAIETGGQFDVRYDQGSGQLQKSTDGGQNWGMVSGGQTVPETV
jgi:hypothetical protein